MSVYKSAEYLYIEKNYERFIGKVRQSKGLFYDDDIIVYDTLTDYIIKHLNGDNYSLYLSDLAVIIKNVVDYPTFTLVQKIIAASHDIIVNLNSLLFTLYHSNKEVFNEVLSHCKALLSNKKYLELFDSISMNLKIILPTIDQVCLLDMIIAVDDPKIACNLFETIDYRNTIVMRGLFKYLKEKEEYGTILYVIGNKEKVDINILKEAVALLITNTNEEIVVPCLSEYTNKEKEELFEYFIKVFADDEELRYKLCTNFIEANPWLAVIYVTYGKDDFRCANNKVSKFNSKLSSNKLDYALRKQDNHNGKILDYFLRLGILSYVINDINIEVIDDYFERRIGNGEAEANTYLIYHEFISNYKSGDCRIRRGKVNENIVRTDSRYLAMNRLVTNSNTASPVYEYLNKGTLSKKNSNK